MIPEDTEFFQPGTTIAGRYEVQRLLGRGATASVYLVLDKLLNRAPLALKQLHVAKASSDISRRRFLREVEINRKVTHQGIVRIYDCGLTPEHIPFYSMEYMEGGSLKELIERDDISLSECVIILRKIALSLDALHLSGICHYDLKPENILLTSNLEPKIVDFSLARDRSEENRDEENFGGSVHYLAPEIWQDEQGDELSDIYSLGAVGYHLITGTPPFQGSTYAELMWKHIEEQPLPPRNLNKGVPQWLEDLLLDMLAKKENFRLQSAGLAAHIINEHLPEVPLLKEIPRVMLREDMRTTASFEAPSRHSTAEAEVRRLFDPKSDSLFTPENLPEDVSEEAFGEEYPEPLVSGDYTSGGRSEKTANPAGSKLFWVEIIIGVFLVVFIVTVGTRWAQNLITFSGNQQRLVPSLLAGIFALSLIGMVVSAPILPIAWLLNDFKSAWRTWLKITLGALVSSLLILGSYLFSAISAIGDYDLSAKVVVTSLQASILNFTELVTLKPAQTLISLHHDEGLINLSTPETLSGGGEIVTRLPYSLAFLLFLFVVLSTIRIDLVKFYPPRTLLVEISLLLLIGFATLVGNLIVPSLNSILPFGEIKLALSGATLKLSGGDILWVILVWSAVAGALALSKKAIRR